MTNIRGDEHCVINAILESMRAINHPATPSTNDLLEMVRFEILSNIEFYRSNLVASDDFVKQLEDYISNGNYTSDAVDLVILAASNALNLAINIYVIENNSYLRFELMKIEPKRTLSNHNINVLRVSDHFNSIVMVSLQF